MRMQDPTQSQQGPSAVRMRVVIADDDVLLREGVASLLDRHNFAVVGQAGDAVQLLELVREHAPDLVIVDIRMPPTHTSEGLEAARAIREESPRTAILLLSAHVEIEQRELGKGLVRGGSLIAQQVEANPRVGIRTDIAAARAVHIVGRVGRVGAGFGPAERGGLRGLAGGRGVVGDVMAGSRRLRQRGGGEEGSECSRCEKFLHDLVRLHQELTGLTVATSTFIHYRQLSGL